MSELLKGIRVIESATLFNGDTVGALLADLGADVIKVESPFQGDYLRDFLGQITPHHSPAHVQINKNKRSVTLDLRAPEALDAFWKLLATADVFVDGNASDACAKLGIGYEAQKAHKADIIYCQYTGYGSTGPYSRIPTHGQMMGALAAVFPHDMGADGFMHASTAPTFMGGMVSGGEGTSAGAVHAALHVAAALTWRARTGEGTFIDVAGSDGVIVQAWLASVYALNDHRIADRRSLPAGSTGAKYNFYETRDKQVILFCCIEPKFWDNFCSAVDRPDLTSQKDTTHAVDFGADDDELRHELQRLFHTRDLADWVALAAEHDIAMGPAYRTLGEAAEDPHMRTRDVIHEGHHPDAGPFTYVGEAGKVSGQPFQLRYPAPKLGEHTRELLSEVGIDDDALDRLAAAGTI